MKTQQHKNIKIFLNYVLGPLLFAWLAWSVFRQVKNQPDLEHSWNKIRDSFSSPSLFYLVAVAALMFVNWGLEAIKWKTCVQPVQPVSFRTSFRAVLAGVSFAVSTPNRMGEYLGRVLYMQEGSRMKVIALTILGSISQLIITLIFGLSGLLVLNDSILSSGLAGSSTWLSLVITGGGLALLLLLFFYFRVHWFTRWMDKIPPVKKYAWVFSGLDTLNATILLRLLSLSLARYLVFALQYGLLFKFFGVEVTAGQGFWALAIVFFMMAVIPAIALFEIVQKVYITKEVFAMFTANVLGINLVTTTIWFINLVIPAIIGSVLILGIKIFKKENEPG
jgi:hypothetical protein